MLVKKLLVNNWRIMNNFVTKLSVEDRVFCPFALWNQRYHIFVSRDATNSHSAAHANNFL